MAGNFKYDFDAARGRPGFARGAAGSSGVRPARVWIAASTMPPAEAGDPDEDDAVIAAWLTVRERHAGLLP